MMGWGYTVFGMYVMSVTNKALAAKKERDPFARRWTTSSRMSLSAPACNAKQVEGRSHSKWTIASVQNRTSASELLHIMHDMYIGMRHISQWHA